MSLADPARFDSAPTPPAALAGRVAAAIAEERLGQRRRRLRFGFAIGAAAAAAAAIARPPRPARRETPGPEQHRHLRLPAEGREDLGEADPERLRDRDPHVREGRLLGHPLPGLPAQPRRRPALRRHLPLPLGRRELPDPELGARPLEDRTMEIEVGNRTFVANVSQGPTEPERRNDNEEDTRDRGDRRDRAGAGPRRLRQRRLGRGTTAAGRRLERRLDRGRDNHLRPPAVDRRRRLGPVARQGDRRLAGASPSTTSTRTRARRRAATGPAPRPGRRCSAAGAPRADGRPRPRCWARRSARTAGCR